MKFWDSSALIPLLVEEEVTIPLRDLYLGEPGTITWWCTPVECASAVSRLEREGRLSPQAATDTLERLDALSRHWHRIEPVDAVLEPPGASSESILFVLRIPSNSRQLSLHLRGDPRPSSSSVSMTGS